MAFNYRRQIEEEAGLHRSPNRLIRWEEMQNPIPASLSEADYNSLFAPDGDKPYFVPYAGWGVNSVHSYLDMLIMLGSVSCTHGSCISSQNFVCLGGHVDIKGDRQRFAYQEETELSPQEKDAYAETLSKFLPDFDPKKIFEDAFTWGKLTGDRWYMVSGDATMAKVEVLDPRNVLYYVDPKVPYKVLGVGLGRLDNKRVQDEDYMLVPEYPQVGQYEGGWRTILHFKDGKNIWYGRPDSEQALITMFREYKDDEYFLKASNNHFTGRAILEFEDYPVTDDDDNDDDAREDGYEDFSAQVDANLTNKASDPMAFMMMTRPAGATPSVLHQVGDNTAEGFFDFLNSTAYTKIIMAHKWSQKLLGIEDASGFSTNVFTDVLKVKKAGVISKYQDMLSAELKECLDVVGAMFGFENNARFVPTTPFDSLLEEKKAMAQQISGQDPEIDEEPTGEPDEDVEETEEDEPNN